MADITSLPYELVTEITSKYLTTQDLKSLRLAFPSNPIITSTTASLLFHSITLRLGNRHNSHERLISKSKYVTELSRFSYSEDPESEAPEDYNKNNTSPDGIFQYVRKMTVDVRYPFVVSPAILKQHEAEGRMARVRPGGDKMDFEELVGLLEGELFLDTFEEVFEKVARRWGQLKELRVHISDVMPYKQTRRLLTHICKPAHTRSHILSICHVFRNLQTIEMFLDPISDCDNLDISFNPHSISPIAESEIDPVIETLARCPDIRGLQVDTRLCYTHEDAAENLWSALLKIEGLERLQVKMMDAKFIKPVPRLLFKDLKSLELTSENTGQGDDSTRIAGLLKTLSASGIKLEKLALTRYSQLIGHELPSMKDTLTHLEIRGELGVPMEPYPAEDFWQNILPVLAPRLKTLKVYSAVEGQWSWHDTDDNLAKVSLRKCKRLENLMISFWKTQPVRNYITPMVEDLLKHCPRLRVLNMHFCIGHMRKKMNSTEDWLETWTTNDKELVKILKGREFEVVYDKKTYMEWLFQIYRFRDAAQDIERPLAWDYYLQKWKLADISRPGRGTGPVYAFWREEDEYCFEE
ncbi:hypothetical protein TWF481_002092 [Arthrobotrys musiformis]|uniref:F-box domain-containing protein n=1 Tax=Arthrobotrys musiformis TaxID=47236 RepID=A0AAV9VTW2_9PEZI